MIILPPSAQLLQCHNHTGFGGKNPHSAVTANMVEMTKLCFKNWPYFRDHYQYLKGH